MRLSAYWSVLLLAVFAVGFLVAGAPVTKEAAAGAGFALAGAAITRMVDVAQERRRGKAAAQERRRADRPWGGPRVGWPGGVTPGLPQNGA
jgi:hypothetical protein